MAFDNDVSYPVDVTDALIDIRKILVRIAVALEEMNLVVQEQRDPETKDLE